MVHGWFRPAVSEVKGTVTLLEGGGPEVDALEHRNPRRDDDLGLGLGLVNDVERRPWSKPPTLTLAAAAECPRLLIDVDVPRTRRGVVLHEGRGGAVGPLEQRGTGDALDQDLPTDPQRQFVRKVCIFLMRQGSRGSGEELSTAICRLVTGNFSAIMLAAS